MADRNTEVYGKKTGMVWHNILTYPILIFLVVIFGFLAVKSVYGVSIDSVYAAINGCDLEESIETGVGMAVYNYGDDTAFGIIDISARIFSLLIAVFGIVTLICLSDKKKSAVLCIDIFGILLLVFNVGYAVYRYIDVGIYDFFRPAGLYFPSRFAVNFQFTVYAFASLAFLVINHLYYKKRKYMFDQGAIL